MLVGTVAHSHQLYVVWDHPWAHSRHSGPFNMLGSQELQVTGDSLLGPEATGLWGQGGPWQ